MKAVDWTPEQDAVILNRGEKTLRKIAEELGHSPSAVRNRYWRLTNPKPLKNQHISDHAHRGPTKCWSCFWSTNPKGNPCPWTQLDADNKPKFEPVKGWVAVEELMDDKVKTYWVKECPLFREG
ncbi:MAG: hypothetical protein IJD14_05135 [Christensenellaceae bacterium]|nr:hypothetical protein [Christensenellaceae bacterium]